MSHCTLVVLGDFNIGCVMMLIALYPHSAPTAQRGINRVFTALFFILQPMAEARRVEERFFQGHPEYSEVLHCCGTGRLAAHLNTILVDHIRTMLPELKRQVRTNMEDKVVPSLPAFSCTCAMFTLLAAHA